MIVFCPTSDFRATAGRRPLRCPITGEPLEYSDLPFFDVSSIDRNQPGLWRYRAMLPVIAEHRSLITLGEGWTPLLRDRWNGQDVYWKSDAFMPTGSYKDRGVSVMVNWLAGWDVDVVVDDSSGNAGASLACYAARAGMEAWIYVPASAPMPKRSQIAIYGADLIEVPGPRENAAKAAYNATRNSRDTAYASHAWHPAFLLGQMTSAWEIWEQLDYQVPDWIISPTGHGGTLLGAWRGFQHLQRCGLITKLPRLVAVQITPFTAIYDAFHNDWNRVRPHSIQSKVSADGIAISHPVRDATLLAALNRSRGTAVAVTDEDVMATHEQLARRGLFVEPTSATVAVALDQLRGVIKPDETVVCVLTGHGLKNPPDPSEKV